ncbi:TPA: hypothetical protein TT574_000280 [Streptococcus equi subsp. zooepidemicus]|nr:hypothetical protein [Streptococcus equi subsp. zooepidemicus]
MALKETGRVFIVKELIEDKPAGCGCVTVALLVGALLYALPSLLQTIFSLALPVLVILGVVWFVKKFFLK